jgi:hypothetical protein
MATVDWGSLATTEPVSIDAGLASSSRLAACCDGPLCHCVLGRGSGNHNEGADAEGVRYDSVALLIDLVGSGSTIPRRRITSTPGGGYRGRLITLIAVAFGRGRRRI